MRPALLATAALLLAPFAAHAQVVERHLPPAPAERGQALATPNALPADQDATPIGRALVGIVVLGPEDAALAAPASGIDTSRIARLDTARAHDLLGGFLGQPLSRRLIGEVEAAIARYYRAAGYPFVALSTPEQEVTSGVLQVRVVEFSAGRIAVTGAKNESDAYILNHVRQRSGAPIDAAALSEDLDWLGRNPFRSARALFSPGDALGRSDLTLGLAETRPWRIYAGVANSGPASTGRTRLFAGLQAAPIPGVPDAVFAYQFTASDDVFGGGHPAYISHAGVADIGIAPRQAIEITLDHVGIAQPSGPFDVRQRIDEATLGWRAGAGAIGDLRVGIEARHARRTVRFAGVPVIAAGADIIQLYGGIEKAGISPLGPYAVSATLHVNPGRIGDANDGATVRAYTDGRVGDARYAYLDMRYAGTIALGRGATLGTEIIGRLASGALPDTEQIGVGGSDLVRGYTLDDGAFDSGIVLRNTIGAPPLSLLGDPKLPDALEPYAFLDAGYARQRLTGVRARPASVGLGARYTLGRTLSGRIEAARAFNTTAYTRSGDWHAHVSLSISY
jgi:hemolysin activation/secretion protein